MPNQVVPITGLADVGVILDTPPVSLPPNAFTNAKNVRFKDGAVRKMEGEVDIFERMSGFLTQPTVGQLQYIAWWPSPNQTVRDAGYYIFVIENVTNPNNIVHDVYAMLPDAMFDEGSPTSRAEHYHRIGTGFNPNGKWQHTLFNGGFTFIINNGRERPQYVTDAEGNLDITALALSDLPGWDSYQINELLLSDTFTDTSSRVFDTGQTRVENETQYIVEVDSAGTISVLIEGDGPGQYTVTRENNQDVITFGATAVQVNDVISIRFQSINPVVVRAAIVRAFGDFLVAGNLIERSSTQSALASDINAGDTAITLDNAEAFDDSGTGRIGNDVFTWTNKNSNTLLGIPSTGENSLSLQHRMGDEVTQVTNLPIIRRLTGVVRTSDVAQPGSIPNNWNPFAAGVSTADEFVIADTGTVQDMVPLQGNMYLYTNSSISVMRLTGNATIPLAVQPVTDQYGALTTDAVVEYDGKHFVIGSDDIYLFGGHPGSIQSISDKKVRRSFFDRVNPINTNTRNLFTLRYAARDEIWICFPTVDSVRGESDEAYIWNYRNGTWTIRQLNSVIRGDIAPVPGGGIPSAIISMAGESGTDDIITVGSREVQTINVATTATVGHDVAARPEIYTFDTLESSPGGDPRPALTLDAPELIEVTIGSDFYAGPNPAMQEYNVENVPTIMAGNFASGGARFRIEYATATANTGNNNTMITVHANELTLPGTGNRSVSGTDYAAALAAHLDGLTEFQNWTITSFGTTISFVSDYAGRRDLIGLDITTFTSTVESITDTGPFTDTSRVFNDSFGDELFTVTRSGSAGAYTFTVTTTRDTGFDDSDGITQLAFITDSTTYPAPDPFSSANSGFTFPSVSGSYEIRSTPPANFVNLVREMDRIPDSGNIDAATTTEDGVTVTRAEIQGGFLQQGTGDSTAEGVTIDVRDTSTMASSNTAVVGSSSSVIDSGNTYNLTRTNEIVRINTSSRADNANLVKSYRTSDGTQVLNGCNPDANSCTTSQGIAEFGTDQFGRRIRIRTIWPTRPSDDVIRSWTHSAASGEAVTSIITSWGLGTFFTNPNTGMRTERTYSGFGVEYANDVRLFFATGDNFGDFFFSNQGADRSAGGILSTHTGDVRVEYGGAEMVSISSREFDVTNNNPYPITFRAQGSAMGTVLAASSSLTTVAGTTGNTDERWAWSSGAISFTGTSIGGSGTTDLRGATGRRTTTMNGVTVTSQNTSSPQTTTTGTARNQAVLLPSSNGGSVANPLTATWNPNRDFSTVNWTGQNRTELLGAYQLSNGARVGGGGAHGRSNNPPSGWDNGFESGSFPQTPMITASNIPNPVAMGAVSQTVSRGVQNCGSQGCVCQSFRAATATSNFGSNGIRQSGTGRFDGPAVGIQGRRGRSGFGWTVPSTGRSNECGGNLNNGVSFSGDFRVYTPMGGGSRATGVRLVLFGPSVTTSVTVPRSSSETYTVNNTNPFPVVLTVGSQEFTINADTTRSDITVNSEGNNWTLASAAPTTNYQFTVTNNNVRPLVSGSLVHNAVTTDLTGLAPGASVTGGLSTMSTAVVNFVREVEQAGAMTVTTPADLIFIRSGVGTTPTDPDDLEAVRYNFSVNFTDSTTDIDVDYQTPENRNPLNDMNLDNIGAVAGFVAALNADTQFTTYFRTITNSDDSEIPTDRFRIEALAAPGNTIPGTTMTMPPHDAVVISTAVDQQNGGDADIMTASIQRGTVGTHEPITINFEQGESVPQSDGTFMNMRRNFHSATLNGSFPAGITGGHQINEVVRDSLRLDPLFSGFWDFPFPIVVNPIQVQMTSSNDGPQYIQLNSVTPAASGLLPSHFELVSTQRGTAPTPMGTMVRYPTITLESPLGDPTLPQTIELVPPGNVNLRLDNIQITDIIRSSFNAPGWAVISGNDNNIGSAPNNNQIRIVRTTDGEVSNGSDQTLGWRVTNIDYGNTGVTLPGLRDSSNDGNAIGRLNLTDFTKVDTDGETISGGVLNPMSQLVFTPSTTNAPQSMAGMGDRLDFRGSRTERSQPTRVMIGITNPDINSLDPAVRQDGNYADDMGNVNVIAGNTQYIPLVFGGTGNYNPADQTGSQPGARRNAEFIINSMQSAITTRNRRVQVMRPGSTELTVIPSQFSGLANFVVEVFTNDTADNVARWNAIIDNNSATQTELTAARINTMDFGGIQSTVPTPVDSTTDEQFNPGNRIPNFADQNVDRTGLITVTSNINTEFDPLRPWPTAQVNLNQEYPIFVTSILDSDTGDLTQNFRGADIGFLYLLADGDMGQYESFLERIELALTPEFDTEQLQSLALWADGGSRINFTQPTEQATLDVKLYGTNSPGETLGLFDNTPFTRNEVSNRLNTTTMMQRTVDNEFKIGQDYKIDMRVHGRFINILISDYQTNTEGSRNPNPHNMDDDNGTARGISWNLSGMQADVVKGGRR